MKKILLVGLITLLMVSCAKENLVKPSIDNEVSNSPNFIIYDSNNPDQEVKALLKAAGVHDKANDVVKVYNGVLDPESISGNFIRCFVKKSICAVEVYGEVGTLKGLIILPTNNPHRPDIIKGRTVPPIKDVVFNGVPAIEIPFVRE